MGTIRFLLALAVTFVHVGLPPFYSGADSVLAVQCFYVISGFLIARVWDEKYSREVNGLRSFYRNRAARIYFMYWAVLFLAVAFGVFWHFYWSGWPPYLAVDPKLSLQIIAYEIISNLTLAGSSIALWLGATPDGALYFTSNFRASPFAVWSLLTLAPAWTLELELWFYVLAPFILRLRLHWIAAVAVASFAARLVWYSYVGESDPWLYRFFPFELGLFLCGAISYKIFGRTDIPRSLAIIALAVTVTIVAVYMPSYVASHRLWSLVAFAAAVPAIFNLTKNWKFDRFLADMSFPLYLVHWPIMMAMTQFPPISILGWSAAVQTLLSVCAAATLVVFVERPIDKWRHSLPSQPRAQTCGDNSGRLTITGLSPADRSIRACSSKTQTSLRWLEA